MKNAKMIETVRTVTTITLKDYEDSTDFDALKITLHLCVTDAQELITLLYSMNKIKGKVYAIKWLREEYPEVSGLRAAKEFVEYAIDYYA